MTLRTRLLRHCRLVLLLASAALFGQVSPGPLSQAHSALDSPLKCTSCHAVGAGAPRLHCLTCHREIRQLVAARSGYHGRVADRSKGDLDCARCHTEHYGRNFSIVRWTTSRDEFAGFVLKGAHEAVACHDCPGVGDRAAGADRKFRFASRACTECHRDPHDGQFPAAVERRHVQSHRHRVCADRRPQPGAMPGVTSTTTTVSPARPAPPAT